jgi:UDPglucose 6-dehydrogenase
MLSSKVIYAENPESALGGADALIICTDWDEFKQPDFGQMKQYLAHPVIFDGRNLYQPEHMREAGFTYYSVGRAVVKTKARTPRKSK